VVVQIKSKFRSDGNAELDPRPIGLPRDLQDPLPYLALYLELGNESTYNETRSHIKVSVPKPTADGQFQKLTDAWVAATAKLESRKGRKQTKAAVNEQKKEVRQTRLAMDIYNRYSVSVRGASSEVYGILEKAQIQSAFDTLLSVTLPSPAHPDVLIQKMRPVEHLAGAHMAWMSTYIVGDVDVQMEDTEDDLQ
jgi:hypothetical protein